jgi:HlyD family secretion protein
VVGGIVYAFLPQPVPVDLGTVSRGPLSVTVDEDGKTRIRDRYLVSSPLNGRMHRVVLKPGDSVKQGETILASIEPTDPALLDPREVALAESRVKLAEATLKQARPQMDRAQAASEMSRTDFQRIRNLRRTGTKTQEELETAQQVERMKNEELKSAQIAIEIAQHEKQIAEAALLRTKANGDNQPTGDDWRLDIRAPITGKVLRVLQESSRVVTPGTPILELGDPADLEVEIDVLSTDAVKVPPHARVLLDQWGGQKPLEAVVRLVEPSGFTKISALGVEEQRVNVIADLQAPISERPSLGDAFRVEARIVVWSEPNVLKVPTAALYRRGKEWATLLARDGEAVEQRLQVGHTNGLETEIVAGLKDGDVVVLHPGDRVKPGNKLAPRPK